MIRVNTSKMYMTLKQGFASVAHRNGPHQLCDIKTDNLQLQMMKEILTNKSSIQEKAVQQSNQRSKKSMTVPSTR
jgi:hypothetical protein